MRFQLAPMTVPTAAENPAERSAQTPCPWLACFLMTKAGCHHGQMGSIFFNRTVQRRIEPTPMLQSLDSPLEPKI